MKCFGVCAAVLAAGLWTAHAAVPPPSAMKAKVLVSGRTATAIDVPIACVGQEIPRGVEGTIVNNSTGFVWYVSEHFAVKSSRDEAYTREILLLCELEYPFLVWVVGGREPADIKEARLVVTCASSFEQMQQAMFDDIGVRGGGGGGTTMWNHIAYNYPSGSARCHQRGLVLHENVHLMIQCVRDFNEGPLKEGATIAFEQHVYDSERKQLTVGVLDKGPDNNYYAGALARMRKQWVPISTFYGETPLKQWSYDAMLIRTMFMWTDPDRLMKWKILRDELIYGNVAAEGGHQRLMTELFGPSDLFEADWRRWISARRNTFRSLCWGWEQEGERIWSYGFPPARFPYTEMEVFVLPCETPVADPLRMDYARSSQSPLIGRVQRGVAEPSVGFVMGSARNKGQGKAGIAMGVVNTNEADTLPDNLIAACPDRRPYPVGKLEIWIEGEQNLVVKGESIGMTNLHQALPSAFVDAVVADDHQLGMTLKIARRSLEIVLRAGPPEAQEIVRASLPLDAEQRDRLMTRHLAMLSLGARHDFTPYLDIEAHAGPDPETPCAPNRWGFNGEDELYRLYRAAWRMGMDAPASLIRLKERLLTAMDKDAATQRQAMAVYHAEIAEVIEDVKHIPNTGRAMLGLKALFGLSSSLVSDAHVVSNQASFTSTFHNEGPVDAVGTVTLQVSPPGVMGHMPEAQPVVIAAGGDAAVTWTWPVPVEAAGPVTLRARTEVACNGTPVVLQDKMDFTIRPSIPCWAVIGPFDNPGGATADLPHGPEGVPVDLSASFAGLNGERVVWQSCRRTPDTTGIGADFIVDLNALYGTLENVAAYAVTWVTVPQDMDAVLAVGSEDGFVAWVNGERVGKVLKPGRAYKSKGDKMPVHLKAGENEVRLKITLTQYGWRFGAHLLASDGTSLELDYHLMD